MVGVPELTDVPVAPLTTLQVGGPAARLVEAGSAEEIVAAVRGADSEGTPVLPLGGGSNLLLADEGWPGLVVLLRSRGVEVADDGAGVLLTVAAGEPWDDLVERCVGEGWAGVECLSGVPGLAGATPIQNVGAYGQEVAETITSVRVLDRKDDRVRDMPAGECGFRYRDSVFKHNERYVVLAVTFRLARSGESAPLRYPELASVLGVPAGQRVPMRDARKAVLELRRAKGMVLDPHDPDTRSAGSFFTNPILPPDDLARFAARLPDGTEYPHWPVPEGTKLSAAWLIDRAGFGKGHRRGPAGLSTKHSLAITNRGGATAEDLVALAREVRDGVRERFSVTLVPEPTLTGIVL